jgi:hypothetical protein
MDRRSFLLAAAAAPFAVQRLQTGPLAYVTCDLQSSVAVVDLERGAVLHRIRTHPDPRSIEKVGDAAVVAHTISGRLSILRHGDVVHEVDGFAEPRYTNADGRIAWVTDSGEPQVVAVDVVRGTIVRRIKLKQWPRHLSRRGDTLVVALGTASSEVAVVRKGDVRYRKTPYLVHDVGFSPRGKLWLTHAEGGPEHVTFLGDSAYVTNGSKGTVTFGGRTIPIPVGSYNVQAGEGRVITPSLDTGTLTVVGGPTVEVAESSHDACFV